MAERCLSPNTVEMPTETKMSKYSEGKTVEKRKEEVKQGWGVGGH